MGGRRSRRKGAEFEREVANWIGGKRNHRSGADERQPGDVDPEGTPFETYHIECKRRAAIAGPVLRWLKEAEQDAECQYDGKTPLLVMREDNGQKIVVLYGEDFKALLEDFEDYRIEDEYLRQ